MTSKALEQLEIALNEGQQLAVKTVLKHTHAPLKSITPEHSLDAEFLKLKMKEIREFENTRKHHSLSLVLFFVSTT